MDMRLGERLVEMGRISKGQLDEALREHARSADSLGVVLVDLGFVTTEEVLEVVIDQRRARLGTGRIGDVLVEQGLVTRRDVGRAIAVQRRRGGLLGSLLVEDGCITKSELEEALSEQQRRRLQTTS